MSGQPITVSMTVVLPPELGGRTVTVEQTFPADKYVAGHGKGLVAIMELVFAQTKRQALYGDRS